MKKSMLERKARPTPVLRGFGYVLTLALAMLSLGAPAMQANPADPQGVFDNQIGNIPIVPVDAFAFNADASGGGAFNFRNISGSDWIGLDFFVTLPENTPITCGPGPFFSACEVTPSSSDAIEIGPNAPLMVQYDIGFSGGNGIADQEVFAFNLNDPINGQPNDEQNGSGGWGSGTPFTVIPTSTPEPGSLLLFASGIALIGTFGRFRSHKH